MLEITYMHKVVTVHPIDYGFTGIVGSLFSSNPCHNIFIGTVSRDKCIVYAQLIDMTCFRLPR